MLAFLFAASLVGIDRPIISGADFLAACTSRDSRQLIACTAYFTGVVATAAAFRAQSSAASEEQSFICPGPEANPEGASVEGIQNDPSLASQPATLGILKSLLDAFPCTGPAGPEDNPPNSGDEMGGIGGYGKDDIGVLGD